jgi:hypothetical protein
MNAPTRAPEQTALTTAGDRPAYQVSPYIGGQDLILHGDYFDKIDKLAALMSKAKGAVPRYLLGNPGACFSIALTAVRANFDPFGVARKTWEGPDGTVKYEGQLVIALINNSGLLQDRLQWEYFGPWEKILGKFQWRESKKKEDEHGNPKKYIVKAWDDKDEVGLGVRCFATLKGESKPRVTELLMAQAVVRNSTLWVEDPKQQIGYLSGARWGRLHTPEATMGIYTPEEFDADPPRDMGAADILTPQVPSELIKRGQDAAAKGVAAYQEFWKHCTQLERGLLNEVTDWHEKFKTAAVAADQGRTVDNATPRATPAPTPAPTAAPTAASQADPVTGETTPPPGQQQDGAFQPTWANVMDRMVQAHRQGNAMALDVAADWIEEVADAQQQQELREKYDELKKSLPATS